MGGILFFVGRCNQRQNVVILYNYPQKNMECTAECETNFNFNLQIDKFAQVLTGVFSCRLVGHSPGRFCGSNSSKSILYEPYESAPEKTN